MKIFWLHVNGISQVSHQWWNIWIIYKIITICSFWNVFVSSLRTQRRRYIFHFFFYNIRDVHCLGTVGVYLQQLSSSAIRKFGFLLLYWFKWKSIDSWEIDILKTKHFVLNLQIHHALSIKVPCKSFSCICFITYIYVLHETQKKLTYHLICSFLYLSCFLSVRLYWQE